MNRWVAASWFVVFLLAASSSVHPSQATNSDEAEMLLQAARHKALVDGDLEEAMELCKKVLAEHGGSRAACAQALLQMGNCYEKLGRTELTAVASIIAATIYGEGVRTRCLSLLRRALPRTTSAPPRFVVRLSRVFPDKHAVGGFESGSVLQNPA